MAATAKALLPFSVWPASISQAATPANDNALRAEVIAKPALAFQATKPVLTSPGDDGELYVLSAAWGDEITGTLAIFQTGTWYYFTPFAGMVKKIGTVYYEYVAGAWVALYAALSDYADDAAAAAGGIVVGGLYRTTSTIKVRVA